MKIKLGLKVVQMSLYLRLATIQGNFFTNLFYCYCIQTRLNVDDEGYQNGIQNGSTIVQDDDDDDDSEDDDDSIPGTPPPLPPRRAMEGGATYNPRHIVSPHVNTPSGQDHSAVSDVLNSYVDDYADTDELLPDNSQDQMTMDRLRQE